MSGSKQALLGSKILPATSASWNGVNQSSSKPTAASAPSVTDSFGVRVALQNIAVPSPVLPRMLPMPQALHLYAYVFGNRAVALTVPFVNVAVSRSRALLSTTATDPPGVQLLMKGTSSNCNVRIARGLSRGETTYPVTNAHVSSRLRLAQRETRDLHGSVYQDQDQDVCVCVLMCVF